MLRWYWMLGTVASLVAVIVTSRRLDALQALLEGGKLAHDPLEAGFVRERLSSLRQLRRTALVITAGFAAMAVLAWLT